MFDRRVRSGADTTVFDVMDDVTSKQQTSITRARSDLGQSTHLCDTNDEMVSTEKDTSTYITQAQESDSVASEEIDPDVLPLPTEMRVNNSNSQQNKSGHRRGKSTSFTSDEVQSLALNHQN